MNKRPFSHEAGPLSQPRTAVVLIHYGHTDLTTRCLESLRASEPHPFHSVVVDHGPEGALGACPEATILRAWENPGFGAGCNRGAAWAFDQGFDFVWFLNNDATLTGPTLGQLEHWADAFPQVGLWGLWQVDGDRRYGADVHPPWFATGLEATPTELPPACTQLTVQETLSGAAIFLSRIAWERLGPWPEEHFVYQEDVDWGRRAHQLGLPTVMTPLAVNHPRGSTLGRRSRMSVFYGLRNLFAVHRQACPTARLQRLWMALHALQKRVFQGRWGLLKPTWDAVAAGLRAETGRDPRY